MAQRLLKAKPRKIAPQPRAGLAGRDDSIASKKVVLVGTYKGRQLDRWPGYYNYPLGEDDDCSRKERKSAESVGRDVPIAPLARVNELWLFQGAKAGRFYSAEFVDIFTREELKEMFGYPATGKAHGERYALYKTSETEIYNPASGLAEAVIVRAADFAKRSPKIAKQIKAYLESPDRNDPVAAKLVPKILTEVPRETLRVCEAAVQYNFLEWEPVVGMSPLLGKIESIVMSIGEFGRVYSLSSSDAYAYLKKYKGLAYLDDCHEALSCFPMESLVDDLAQVCRNNGGKLR